MQENFLLGSPFNFFSGGVGQFRNINGFFIDIPFKG
jgi:hypothetical protein